MAINHELNKDELENAYGGPIRVEDLPNKFKQVKKDDGKLTEEDLATVIGGPIKADDLPDWAFTSKNDEFPSKK